MKDLSALTDEEVVEAIVGRKITFVRELAQSEDTSFVRSKAEVYNGTNGERCVRYVSPEGWRFIRVSDIVRISRKTYNN